MTAKKVKQIKITLGKSVSRQKQPIVRTVEALGLKRIRHFVIQDDNDVIRGMVFKVKHLVTVENV